MKNRIKRIYSIILTMLLVFSMITPVFAEEEKAPVEVQVEVTQEAASDAQTEVEKIDDTTASESVDASIQDLTIVETNVETVLTENAEILENISNLETAVSSTEEKINNAIEELETFANEENPIMEDSNSAISNAETANTTKSKKEAYQAKDDAKKDLASAENELSIAEEAYDQATQNVAQVEKEYKDIQEEKGKIEEQISKTEEALKTAKENSTAALEALKAAKSRLNLLEQQQDKLVSEKEDLEAIQQQYYAMMVYYYRDLLKKNAAFDEEGHLDISANAELAAGLSDGKSEDPNKDVMKLSRNLMEKLVNFMITENGGEVLSFAATGKDKKDTAEGQVFTNNQGEDQTKLVATPQQKWDNVKGESGRNNHVTVTYKDKDGNTVTEYYNYIFKASQYNDETDLTKGPIYLALVKYNEEDKKWEAAAVNDENNYDDYKKLTETLDAINNLKDYSDAKEAVGKAQAEVEKLQEELNKLKIAKVDETTINEIAEKLKQAQEYLADAKETKAKLEDKVEEARKAVAGIDLSRFNIKDDDDDEDDDPAPGTPDPTPVVPAAPVTPDILPILPASTVVSRGLAPIVVEEEVEEPVRNLGEFVNLEDEKLPAAPSVTTLDDNELPAAQEAETSPNYLFWIIMLILLIIALLVLIYAIRKAREQSNK